MKKEVENKIKEEIKKYLFCLIETILGFAILSFALWAMLFIAKTFNLLGFFIVLILVCSVLIYLEL